VSSRLPNCPSIATIAAAASLLGIALAGAGCATVTPKSGSTQTGSFGAVQVTPSVLSFGNQVLQSTVTQNVTIQNTGNINITISGITVVGAGFGYSTLSPGSTLTPKQSVTFQVWFRPQTSGSAAGQVSILSSNLTTPASISVSGMGVTSTSTPPTQHSVSLSWGPSSSPVAGYRVYRDGGTGFLALSAVIPALTYADSTVVSGSTYQYAVTAVDSAGAESPFSNQVTTVIATP
jgi:Cep192 domain 4